MIDQRAKRAACLIASQLPEDAHEAMMVLEYAADIIRHLQNHTSVALSPFSIAGPTGLVIVPRGEPANRNDCRGKANPV